MRNKNIFTIQEASSRPQTRAPLLGVVSLCCALCFVFMFGCHNAIDDGGGSAAKEDRGGAPETEDEGGSPGKEEKKHRERRPPARRVTMPAYVTGAHLADNRSRPGVVGVTRDDLAEMERSIGSPGGRRPDVVGVDKSRLGEGKTEINSSKSDKDDDDTETSHDDPDKNTAEDVWIEQARFELTIEEGNFGDIVVRRSGGPSQADQGIAQSHKSDVRDEINELLKDLSKKAKRFGGDVSREEKKAAGDIAREGKKAAGDIAREGKKAAGDIAREGKKARDSVSEGLNKLGQGKSPW